MPRVAAALPVGMVLASCTRTFASSGRVPVLSMSDAPALRHAMERYDEAAEVAVQHWIAIAAVNRTAMARMVQPHRAKPMSFVGNSNDTGCCARVCLLGCIRHVVDKGALGCTHTSPNAIAYFRNEPDEAAGGAGGAAASALIRNIVVTLLTPLRNLVSSSKQQHIHVHKQSQDGVNASDDPVTGAHRCDTVPLLAGQRPQSVGDAHGQHGTGRGLEPRVLQHLIGGQTLSGVQHQQPRNQVLGFIGHRVPVGGVEPVGPRNDLRTSHRHALAGMQSQGAVRG